MSPSVGLRQSMQLRQQLVMTQRLQQALKLLQVPTLELEQILRHELQGNPLLEEIEPVEQMIHKVGGKLVDAKVESQVKKADGKVAVVTGANRGLGLETCRQLAQRHRHATGHTGRVAELFQQGVPPAVRTARLQGRCGVGAGHDRNVGAQLPGSHRRAPHHSTTASSRMAASRPSAQSGTALWNERAWRGAGGA